MLLTRDDNGQLLEPIEEVVIDLDEGHSGAVVQKLSERKADLIEIAALRTGGHVAGSYMAVWSLGQKLFQAVAVGMALPIVSFFGFESITQTVPRPSPVEALSGAPA